MPSLQSSDPRDVSERVVIVTGGAQGIGRRYAQAFAAAGAIPVIADINIDAARRVEDEIAQAQGCALAVGVDVADPRATERMSETVLEKFGRIDVLINNAAVFSTLAMRPFDQIPLDEWERVLRVNTTGPYLCVRAVAPAMRKAR